MDTSLFFVGGQRSSSANGSIISLFLSSLHAANSRVSEYHAICLLSVLLLPNNLLNPRGISILFIRHWQRPTSSTYSPNLFRALSISFYPQYPVVRLIQINLLQLSLNLHAITRLLFKAIYTSLLGTRHPETTTVYHFTTITYFDSSSCWFL